MGVQRGQSWAQELLVSGGDRIKMHPSLTAYLANKVFIYAAFDSHLSCGYSDFFGTYVKYFRR